MCVASSTPERSCAPESQAASLARTSFPTAKQEIEAAAKWARARLENRGQSPISSGGSRDAGNRALTPISPRIGIVVPDLGRRRSEVVRVSGARVE